MYQTVGDAWKIQMRFVTKPIEQYKYNKTISTSSWRNCVYAHHSHRPVLRAFWDHISRYQYQHFINPVKLHLNPYPVRQLESLKYFLCSSKLQKHITHFVRLKIHLNS